jgi:uncharacterized membrane protein YedE/YeeE
MVLSLVVPEHVATNVYYKAIKPILDWQFLLVIGIPIGAYLSARLSQGTVHFSTRLPEAWVNRFGTSHARRWVLGIIGGILVGFGARMADGCTSGHALSGGLQLAVSGWVFFAAMMVSGLILARLIFRRT